MTSALQPHPVVTQDHFFQAPLSDSDPEIYAAVQGELRREHEHIELI
jgi:glycine/serine hydroxymethyltransferase